MREEAFSQKAQGLTLKTSNFAQSHLQKVRWADRKAKKNGVSRALFHPEIASELDFNLESHLALNLTESVANTSNLVLAQSVLILSVWKLNCQYSTLMLIVCKLYCLFLYWH